MNNLNSLTANGLTAEESFEPDLSLPLSADSTEASLDAASASAMTSLPGSLYELVQNLIVLELIGLLLGTPGSDAFIFGRPDKNDTLLTRQGNDLLLAVDPAAERPGNGEIDLLAGDLDLFEVFPLPGVTPYETNPRRWSDKFILGDERQPYYLGSDANDYAKILDFDPLQDTIQLHGAPEDYQIVETTNDTEIYWQQAEESDLVASLSGVSGLSLTEDYFQFETEIPSETPVLEEIEQFGTPSVDLPVGIASNAADAIETADGVYLTGATGDSFWVAKYDDNGELEWQEESPSTGNIDTDNSGNVYVGGGLGDVAIAKYSSEGEQFWSQDLGTFSLDNSFNLDVDPFGNVYLTGYTLGDLGGENAGELAAGPFPLFSTDAWLAKYDPDGNQQWINQFGSGDFDEAFAIATDSEGNAYTSGWTLGELGATNVGLYDIWVAKNDSDGNQQWLQQFGSEDYDWSWDAAIDSEDNLYITGWTLGDLGATNAGSYDAWVAKYDPDGDRQWLKQFGTVGDDASRSVDLDDFGNFYLTGYTDDDLGGINSGSYDTWVAKYDRDGNLLWQQQFGTSEIDNPFDLTVDRDNRVFVTGFTTGSLGEANTGANDGWLAELSATDGSLLALGQNNTEASLPVDAEVAPVEDESIPNFSEAESPEETTVAGLLSDAEVIPEDISVSDFSEAEIQENSMEASWLYDPEVPQNENSSILDFSEVENRAVNIGTEADAYFNNVGGFYRAIDTDGTVVDPLSGARIAVGDAGYETAALANSVAEVGASEDLTLELAGSSVYVPYILADGSEFFSAFADANADGLNHVRTTGDRSYSFEDLLGNGDRDFNDFVINYEFV